MPTLAASTGVAIVANMARGSMRSNCMMLRLRRLDFDMACFARSEDLPSKDLPNRESKIL